MVTRVPMARTLSAERTRRRDQRQGARCCCLPPPLCLLPTAPALCARTRARGARRCWRNEANPAALFASHARRPSRRCRRRCSGNGCSLRVRAHAWGVGCLATRF